VPELPEVESVRRSIAPRVVGARVAAITLHRADIVTGRAAPADLLEGDEIRATARRGKQLALLGAGGRVVIVHLGMSGQLLWLPANTPPKRADHIHARWTLANDRGVVIFRDPRRFGGLWTLPTRDALDAHWSSLGPDALEISAVDLARACAGTRRAIKSVLLDQGVLAGVGNIYADEALFASGIHPLRRASALSEAEIDTLAARVRAVLAAAIDAGGSTRRDYVNAEGEAGGFQSHHAVYGRGGEACVVCKVALREAQVGQRTTVWCDRCQPRTRRAGRARAAD
jgi:formamidopyrimidine-DNA glycosylase